MSAFRLGFTVGWWSLSYGIENTTFKLFDPLLPIQSQIDKRAYASHGRALVYSHYSLTDISGETTFWSAGARVSWDNNLGSLGKVDLTDRNRYSPSPNERISEKKSSAYSGSLRERPQDPSNDWRLLPFFLRRQSGRTAPPSHYHNHGPGPHRPTRRELDF